MGHAVEVTTFSIKDSKKNITEMVNQRAIEESDCHGGLYCDIKWYDRCFDTIEDARQFIEDNDTYSYACLAVRYKHESNFKPSKTLITIREQLKDAREKFRKANCTMHFAEHKSTLVGCKKCGSKIAVKYLHHRNSCPVCNEDLRPDSILKHIAALDEKVKTLEKKAKDREREERLKSLKLAEEYWLVKTEYHV